MCDLTEEALEGELADEQVGRLLVATDLTEGNGSGAVTVVLLGHSLGTFVHAVGTGGLGGKLFVGRFAGCLAGALFAYHFDVDWVISVDDVDVMVCVVEGRYCIVYRSLNNN